MPESLPLTWGDLVVLASFWGLMAANLTHGAVRTSLAAKPLRDWTLDVTGLLVQGLVIPVLQLWLIRGTLISWAPSLVGSASVPGPVAFFVSFVAVDYIFYWNHRLLHGRLWDLHRVHHTMAARDVLGTSRNTLWTSFLICYLWVHGALATVLADPTLYLAGVAATSALDLWRHSTLDPPSWIEPALSPWLILPQDHAWHHSPEGTNINFGANLKLWDRLHGTFRAETDPPHELGLPVHLSLTRQLFWPFGNA